MFRTMRSVNRHGWLPRSLLAEAATPVVCEMLEARQLLTTYGYTVPSGHPDVYLERGAQQG
jgi:hypothetical protein